MNRRDFVERALAGAAALMVGRPAIADIGPSDASPNLQPDLGGRRFFLDAAAGNDTASGEKPGAAWRTLDRVNRHTFAPGDWLLIRGGTRYAGTLEPKGEGSATGGPVRIDRYGDGVAPLIEGEGKVKAALVLRNTPFFEVRNLDITNTGPESRPDRRGVWVCLEDFGTARGIVLERLRIRDVNGSVFKNQNGGGSAILVQAGGRKKPSRYDGLRIERCQLINCMRNGVNFRGNASRKNWFPSLNVVIRGNILEQVPGDGIVPIGCDGALVEHNVMRDCPRLLKTGDAAAGIWPWSSDNTVIQFNEVSDHKAPWDAQGFDCDWNCRNTTIQYNYSHDNEGGFLLVCNNGQAKGSNAGCEGSVIRYNISLNDGLRPHAVSGGRMFSPVFHLSGPINRTYIYNNLIVTPRKPSPRIQCRLIEMDNWGGPWPDNTLFANNIFSTEEKLDWKPGKAKDTLFWSNLFHGPFDEPPRGEDDVFGDPGFLNKPDTSPSGRENLGGFRLRVNSIAHGKGRRMATHGPHDFWGTPLPPGGRISIGPGQLSG